MDGQQPSALVLCLTHVLVGPMNAAVTYQIGHKVQWGAQHPTRHRTRSVPQVSHVLPALTAFLSVAGPNERLSPPPSLPGGDARQIAAPPHTDHIRIVVAHRLGGRSCAQEWHPRRPTECMDRHSVAVNVRVDDGMRITTRYHGDFMSAPHQLAREGYDLHSSPVHSVGGLSEEGLVQEADLHTPPRFLARQDCIAGDVSHERAVATFQEDREQVTVYRRLAPPSEPVRPRTTDGCMFEPHQRRCSRLCVKQTTPDSGWGSSSRQSSNWIIPE
jgi:hypothetical protein